MRIDFMTMLLTVLPGSMVTWKFGGSHGGGLEDCMRVWTLNVRVCMRCLNEADLEYVIMKKALHEISHSSPLK